MKIRNLAVAIFVGLIGFVLATSAASAQTSDVFHHGIVQVPGGSGPFTAQINWTPAFSDANYTATCMIEADLGFLEGRVEIQAGSRTANNMIVGVSELDGTSGLVHCIGVANTSSISHSSVQVAGGFGPTTAEVDWSTPFADKNYFPTCSIEAELGFVEGRIEIQAGSRTATSMIIGVSEIEGDFGIVHCIAVPASSSLPHSTVQNVPPGFGPFPVEIDWSPPFSSANYDPVCSIEAQLDFVEARLEIQAGSRTANNMIIGVNQIGGASDTVYCFGIESVSVSFQSTLADINQSLQLGSIDNQGVATSLSLKVLAAAAAAAREDSQTSSSILRAFQLQVAAQTGVHVSNAASQTLLNDAAALIGQSSP